MDSWGQGQRGAGWFFPKLSIKQMLKRENPTYKGNKEGKILSMTQRYDQDLYENSETCLEDTGAQTAAVPD